MPCTERVRYVISLAAGVLVRARSGRLSVTEQKRENRYVNDLRRYGYGQSPFFSLRGIVVPPGLSIIFLAVVGSTVTGYQSTISSDWLIVANVSVVKLPWLPLRAAAGAAALRVLDRLRLGDHGAGVCASGRADLQLSAASMTHCLRSSNWRISGSRSSR